MLIVIRYKLGGQLGNRGANHCVLGMGIPFYICPSQIAIFGKKPDAFF